MTPLYGPFGTPSSGLAGAREEYRRLSGPNRVVRSGTAFSECSGEDRSEPGIAMACRFLLCDDDDETNVFFEGFIRFRAACSSSLVTFVVLILFAILRYHLLHPDYLYYRIRELPKNFKLRVVLCHVDVLNHALTTVRHVNKTDVVTLGSTFGTLSHIMDASMEDLARCPGIGERKVYKELRVNELCSDDGSGNEGEKEEDAKKRTKKEPETSIKSALSAAFAKYSDKIGKKNNNSVQDKIEESSSAVEEQG
ncbi:hypothetical protein C3L33_13991, partial [Rhododendron williamsianum]